MEKEGEKGLWRGAKRRWPRIGYFGVYHKWGSGQEISTEVHKDLMSHMGFHDTA